MVLHQAEISAGCLSLRGAREAQIGVHYSRTALLDVLSEERRRHQATTSIESLMRCESIWLCWPRFPIQRAVMD
jgi:hypothetical protein